MTAVTFDAGRITPATRPAGALTAATTVAARSVRKFVRTPQLLVISTITGAMFLLIFRYVFGGAIATGPVDYVHFMVPGYIVTSVLFTGSNASSSVAQDLEEGFTDRLRSLPVSHRGPGRPGVRRVGAAGAGPGRHRRHRRRRGLRPQGSGIEALAAFALVLAFGFAFMWMFVTVGLVAGNVQAAQGMSLLIFPLSFVSSAMVPVDSMPGWLQPVAEHQPITVMTNAVRSWPWATRRWPGCPARRRTTSRSRCCGPPAWWRCSPRWRWRGSARSRRPPPFRQTSGQRRPCGLAEQSS